MSRPVEGAADGPPGAAVAEVYDERPGYQWRRLDAMPCEFFIHRSALDDELPPASCVLDIGAGPGRYALEMARAGHRVTVGDISPAMLEQAQHRLADAGFAPGAAAGGGGVDAVLELDARDLGRFDDGSFDAVVAFGPFYHLQDAADRRRAAAEAARVLRPGGLLFAVFMPRTYWLSLALSSFVTHPETPVEQLEQLERFFDDGRLDKVKSKQLKRSWFCRLDEVDPLFAAVGVRRRRLLASNGVATTGPR
ncbi:MAG: class I SAM-dependent methyltransferase, partial [Acidobacteriota bacterium]